MITLSAMLKNVRDFGQKLELYKIPAHPTCLSKEQGDKYFWSFDEETREFASACDKGDLAGAVDAMVDITYLALGRLVEMGLTADMVERAWDSVHRANMLKERGTVVKRPHLVGQDAVKPPGWTAPDYTWLTDARGRYIGLQRVDDVPHNILVEGTKITDTTTGEMLRNPDVRMAKENTHKTAKPPLALVPYELLEQAAMAFDVGTRRYAQWGYINKPLPWSEYISAAIRHLTKLVKGQVMDDDPRNDRPLTHVGCAAAELGMLSVVMAQHPELNDLRKDGTKS